MVCALEYNPGNLCPAYAGISCQLRTSVRHRIDLSISSASNLCTTPSEPSRYPKADFHLQSCNRDKYTPKHISLSDEQKLRLRHTSDPISRYFGDEPSFPSSRFTYRSSALESLLVVPRLAFVLSLSPSTKLYEAT